MEHRLLLANLDWSSFLGGTNGEYGYAIAIDAAGNAWVTGTTYSSDFASGGFDTSFNGGAYDTFVAKINANGTLAWSTLLGGTGYEEGTGIAIDPSGNAWVTGYTSSSGWASGGFDTSFNGGIQDAFVAKINANGTLAWSSYLGGTNGDQGFEIATDNSGNAWVIGATASTDWTSGGFDTSFNGGAQDAFVAKINANGTLAWTSYLGGTQHDIGSGIAVDPSGNAWVTGRTRSSDFASGGFDISFNGGTEDAFVAKINADGTLGWASYLGGTGSDAGNDIATDSLGNAWVTGNTRSSDFAFGGFDTSFNGGTNDAFMAKVNANGTLGWTSYLGGTGSENGLGIATDPSGNAWVTGLTNSPEGA